jgi:hypothetical protein
MVYINRKKNTISIGEQIMKATRSSVKNVVKKLSALRATLSKEEQEILDSIVIASNEEDEVAAHAAQTKVSTARVQATKAISTAADAEPEDDEVAAHAAQTKASTARAQTTKAISTAADAEPEEDEVSAHAMQTKASSTKAAATKAAVTKASATRASSTISVTYNIETGQYEVAST